MGFNLFFLVFHLKNLAIETVNIIAQCYVGRVEIAKSHTGFNRISLKYLSLKFPCFLVSNWKKRGQNYIQAKSIRIQCHENSLKTFKVDNVTFNNWSAGSTQKYKRYLPQTIQA